MIILLATTQLIQAVTIVLLGRWVYQLRRDSDRHDSVTVDLTHLLEYRIGGVEEACARRGLAIPRGHARKQRIEEGKRILFPPDKYPEMYS